MSTMTIGTSDFWIIRKSDSPAFFLPDGSSISYRELGEDVDAFSRKLAAERGLIGIQCDGHYRQYVAYLAALNAGCPVLLLGENQTAPSTHLSLSYLYAPATDDLTRFDTEKPSWHPDLAVLLSTSGSTGSAKWVRLSHRNIASNAASIAEYLALRPDDRAPMALPFQYSYGMSIINSHLAVGAAIVLTEGSVMDARFWEAFDRCGCTSLAGVPHSFDLMEKAQIRTAHLGRLRYMTQAGGRMDPAQVRQWVERGRIEGWDFLVMYGQTEAAPRISYLPPQMALETPSAIGIAIPGGELWIADEQGRPLADGMAGELCYRGPNTMMGYAQSDADLSLAPGSDILNTGDIAKRLPNGAFEIVGRKNRFVKLFGLRIGLDEVDKHLQERGLAAACVAKNDVLYVVTADSPSSSIPDIALHLSEWLGIPARSFHVHPVAALPRQASGKVDLQAIGRMIDALPPQKPAEPRSPPTRTGLRGLADRVMSRRMNSVAEVFKSHFPTAKLSSTTSFDELGGDSLSYVAVSLDLESVLGRLPDDWSSMSVAELEGKADTAGWITSIDTPTLVRSLSIMLIVAGHLELLDYGGGGASALMAVAGMSFAAFTLPQVLSSASIIPILILAIRIGLITVGFGLLTYVFTGYGEWPAFFFIGDWISPDVEGDAWFIDVYLQLLLLLMLALSFSRVRHMTRQQMFKTSIIAAAALVVLAAASDAVLDTSYLYRRLPHLYAWIFMIGVVACAAKSEAEKKITTVVLLLGIWQFEGFRTVELTFFPLAVLALIWVPSIRVPKVFSSGLRMVAGASLIIYLSHFQFASVSSAMFGDSLFLGWIVAILGGVLAWRLYDPVDVFIVRRLRSLLSSKTKESEPV